MSTNFKEIKRSALALDEKRRAELAQQLIISLDEMESVIARIMRYPDSGTLITAE